MRPVRSALDVDGGRAEGAAADHRPRAHDPAHVGREEHAVAGADVRLVRDLARDRDEEAALHVHGALRPAGRARGVREQVSRLAVDLDGLDRAVAARDELVPVDVAACHHRHVVASEPSPDDGVRHGRRVPERLVRGLLHLDGPAAAKRPVGRDQELRSRVREAGRDGGRGEAGEDRHLHGAEVRHGVRGDRRLRRHRQVDPDRVACADPERGQALREPVDLARQLRAR